MISRNAKCYIFLTGGGGDPTPSKPHELNFTHKAHLELKYLESCPSNNLIQQFADNFSLSSTARYQLAERR